MAGKGIICFVMTKIRIILSMFDRSQYQAFFDWYQHILFISAY